MVLGPRSILLPSGPTWRCVRPFGAEDDQNTSFMKRLASSALKCAMNGGALC